MNQHSEVWCIKLKILYVPDESETLSNGMEVVKIAYGHLRY